MPFKPQRQGNPIISGVAIGIIGLVIGLFITSGYQDYAIVGYNLSATDWAFSGEQLKVNFNIKNSGKVTVVPQITITVENATIKGVEIPNVAEYQLSSYCNYTSSCAIFMNLRLSPDRQQLGLWSSIYIIPDEGATSFKINSTVGLPFDFFHPKNEITRFLPWEFVYESSNGGQSFEKLK